jgi:hypothetical protein
VTSAVALARMVLPLYVAGPELRIGGLYRDRLLQGQPLSTPELNPIALEHIRRRAVLGCFTSG